MTTTRPASTDRPPYGLAALTTAVVLTIYVLTVAPTTQFWDTSEYIAAAKGLGIPHPPGNPLFVIMAHVWGYLPLGASYALRINLFSAVMSALGSGFLFLVIERWLRPVIAERWPRIAVAFAGVLVGATAFTVWNQSVVNEKVYTVSLCSIALILWLTVRWGDLTEGEHRDGLLILIAYFLALTSTNHMMGVLVAPAVGLYVLATDWRQVLRPWVVLLGLLLALAVSNQWALVINGPAAARALVILLVVGAFAYVAWREPVEFRQPALYLAILAVVIGISLNVTFLPIRAAQFPAINEGEPTNWLALWSVLAREQYQKPPVTHRMADFPSQLQNYLQYFGWQFGRDWGEPVRRGLAVVFGALGLSGMIVQWRKDRRAALAMTGLMFTVTLLLIFYLNFKYGFSIRPNEQGLDHEVRERDYFYIVSFLLWGVWVALGLGALFASLQQTLRTRLTPRAAWLGAAPVLLLAVVPLAGNRLTASRAGETLARDFAYDMLQSVAPYAILITAGDNDLFPLWHAQEVEGIRRDVVLVNQSLMNTDWHVRQILRRPVYPFDVEHAVGPWRGTNRRGSDQAGPQPQHGRGGLAPTRVPDRPPQLVPVRRRDRDARARRVRAADPGHPDADPRQPRHTADLLRPHHRGHRRSARPDAVPRQPGLRAPAHAQAGHRERQRHVHPAAGVGRSQALRGAAVRRVPSRERRPRAPARLDRHAVGEHPHAVLRDVRPVRRDPEAGGGQHEAGGGAARESLERLRATHADEHQLPGTLAARTQPVAAADSAAPRAVGPGADGGEPHPGRRGPLARLAGVCAAPAVLARERRRRGVQRAAHTRGAAGGQRVAYSVQRAG